MTSSSSITAMTNRFSRFPLPVWLGEIHRRNMQGASVKSERSPRRLGRRGNPRGFAWHSPFSCGEQGLVLARGHTHGGSGIGPLYQFGGRCLIWVRAPEVEEARECAERGEGNPIYGMMWNETERKAIEIAPLCQR